MNNLSFYLIVSYYSKIINYKKIFVKIVYIDTHIFITYSVYQKHISFASPLHDIQDQLIHCNYNFTIMWRCFLDGNQPPHRQIE